MNDRRDLFLTITTVLISGPENPCFSETFFLLSFCTRFNVARRRKSHRVIAKGEQDMEDEKNLFARLI